MEKTGTSLLRYRNKIISIVCLTNIPVILFLPSLYSQAIGWIAGTLASCGNFYWLSKQVEGNIGVDPASSKLAGYKLFYLRFLSLAVYSVIAVLVLKPDIIVYGLGLVSVQLCILGYHLYQTLAKRHSQL